MFVGPELKAAEDARASAAATSKPRPAAKSTKPADKEGEDCLLQQWLDSKQDDSVTATLDLEIAELIEELKPKYPDFTWRDHLYVHCRPRSSIECFAQRPHQSFLFRCGADCWSSWCRCRYYWFVEKLGCVSPKPRQVCAKRMMQIGV